MKAFGVVTKSGTFVGNDVLAQYATKAESKRIKDSFSAQYKPNGLVEPLYNPEQLAKLLEINTYHWRAVKTKARDTAGLGWDLKKTDEELPDDAVPSSVAELRDFFDSLTPPLSALLDRACVDYESVGWATLELIRQDYATEGPFVDMEHIPSHTVRIHKDGQRVLQQRGKNKRWFKLIGAQIDVDAEDGKVYALGELEATKRATEVMFWTNYTPRSDYYGLPDVMPALGAIQGEIARRDYNIAFFDNFGVPAYAVFITGKFSEGDIETDSDGVERSAMQAAIERHFQELAKNPHSTLILTIPGTDVKVEFKPLAVDVKEASFRLYRADNRDEILASHGVPPYRAGIAETGSLGGSTAQESTEIYKRSVIEPRQSIIEHYFNLYIVRLAFGVTTHEWKLNVIDTADEQHDMDLMLSLVNAGAMTKEELRATWADRFGLRGDLAAAEDEETIPTEEDIADLPTEALQRMAENMLERVSKRYGRSRPASILPYRSLSSTRADVESERSATGNGS